MLNNFHLLNENLAKQFFSTNVLEMYYKEIMYN